MDFLVAILKVLFYSVCVAAVVVFFIFVCACMCGTIILIFELLRGNPVDWYLIVSPIGFCLSAGLFIALNEE